MREGGDPCVKLSRQRGTYIVLLYLNYLTGVVTTDIGVCTKKEWNKVRDV